MATHDERRASGVLTARAALLMVLGLCGCTPLLPFHFGETATVLERGQLSLTVSAGGGGAKDLDNCCGGGAVRASVGVGRQVEVGVESAVEGAGNSSSRTVALAAKARVKWGPIPYLALIGGLGLGGTVSSDGNGTRGGDLGLGGDVGLVASTPLLARRLRVYGGARFSFVVPAVRDVYASGGPTEGVIVPAGVSVEATERVRLFFEGGFVGAFSQNRVLGGGAVRTNEWYGGYGAFSVAFLWNVFGPKR